MGLGAFGKQPDVKQIEVLASTNWLQFFMRNPTQTEPIPGAVDVFTDGFKGSMGVVYVEGNQPQAHVFPFQSAQAVVGAVSICFLHYSCVRNVCNLCSVSEFFQSCKSVACNWCNAARKLESRSQHKDEGMASIDCCHEQHPCGDCNFKAVAGDHPGNCGILKELGRDGLLSDPADCSVWRNALMDSTYAKAAQG